MGPGLGRIALGLLLVGLGCVGVFAGFEQAAYQQTLADREVTTSGDPINTEVSQLPDGNWTYEYDYEYTFDQRSAVLDQGLDELYIERVDSIDSPADMADEQLYTNHRSGGKYSSQSSARRSMESEFNDDGSVTVYVDPFYPAEGALSDATDWTPEALQYGGAAAIAVGLAVLARMARRVSA